MTNTDSGHIYDSTIKISVQGGQYDGQTLEFDAMVVKLAADELVAKHKLKPRGGEITPTAEFAIELDAKMKQLGYQSSPTIAVHAWVAACDYFVKVQKKTKRSPSSRTGTGSTRANSRKKKGSASS